MFDLFPHVSHLSFTPDFVGSPPGRLITRRALPYGLFLHLERTRAQKALVVFVDAVDFPLSYAVLSVKRDVVGPT